MGKIDVFAVTVWHAYHLQIQKLDVQFNKSQQTVIHNKKDSEVLL